ncbi:GyrI-like domain-containing protein [uncultured Dubosiella sp.]|uniref:GyrI-like domain-containing protein n=1 Tax=uncultured Dubosiella sp. TaxID=1937011 RepID=UPI00259A54F2|nr:helix-turn-helix domain-containing protein [uncultured Dubosiella sp.]
MNWIECLQSMIDVMENHLQTPLEESQIYAGLPYSAAHLRKGFSIVAGYSPIEYLRSRRLACAGQTLWNEPDQKILDVALEAGYDSAESFSRAFKRFHNATALEVRQHKARPRLFLRLQIRISVQGGDTMNYTTKTIPSFTVIGLCEPVADAKQSYAEIPAMWSRFSQRCARLMENGPQTDFEKAVWTNNIGEFGLCFDKGETIEYMIAGKYREGGDTQELSRKTIPAYTWAIFDCYGPLPGALQAVNEQIFTEWLPRHPELSLIGDLSVEWYSMGDPASPNYHSQIWIPIQTKS